MPRLSVSILSEARLARSSLWSQRVTSALTLRPGAKLAVEFEQRLDGHFLVKAALFGKISDEVRAGFGPAISEEADLAAIGIEDVHDHAHRGGFARAVRPDKPVDRT